MAWLKDLPYKHREADVEFCHGAPVAPELFDYLFAPEQALDLLVASMSWRMTFIGHSHLTISFRIDRNSVTPLLADEIVCESDAKYIITVGSVGQPRDRDPRTCCGIFDTNTRTFSFHRLEYDVMATRRRSLPRDCRRFSASDSRGRRIGGRSVLVLIGLLGGCSPKPDIVVINRVIIDTPQKYDNAVDCGSPFVDLSSAALEKGTPCTDQQEFKGCDT
ncbi:MAG: hypothetical protein R3C68_09630 [Myxococcota bacterium]